MVALFFVFPQAKSRGAEYWSAQTDNSISLDTGVPCPVLPSGPFQVAIPT